MKTAADVGKIKADTDKATTDARAQQMQVLSNAADGLANSPGPLMPEKVVSFLRQAQYIGAAPLVGDIVSAAQSGDEGALRSAFKNFSQAGSTMAQRASANKENVGANLAPQEFDLKRYQAMVDAATKIGGEVKQDLNGNLVIVRPLAGVQMPTPPGPAQPAQPAPPTGPQAIVAPTVPAGALPAIAADAQKSGYQPPVIGQATQTPSAPVAPASGPSAQSLPMVQPVGVQAALSPAQAGQDKARTQMLEESRKAASAAQETLRILPQLRSTLAQGYTGPLAASEAGRMLLNLAVTTGAVSPEQAARVGAMRASDALVTELLGPMAHSLSQRGMTAQSQKLIERSKPGTENSLETAQAMIGALGTDARNVVNYDAALNKYVTSNPTDYGMSNWPNQMPKPIMPPPPGKVTDQLPPPSVANYGMKAYDHDTGRVYINRTGSKWELVQ
jgi:hypothetical protein